MLQGSFRRSFVGGWELMGSSATRLDTSRVTALRTLEELLEDTDSRLEVVRSLFFFERGGTELMRCEQTDSRLEATEEDTVLPVDSSVDPPRPAYVSPSTSSSARANRFDGSTRAVESDT